ncbi:MAG: phage holin family protein, partial [Actinobacteria bacterium]|nr:phage holin family protein [Actinomycetota bacterium]
MATTRPRTEDIYRGGAGDEKSAGQLFKEVTEDISTLVHKEIELAKQ